MKNIDELISLVTLHLEWNKLTAFPDSLPRLTNLTSLRASQNEIGALPVEIGGLKALVELLVDTNFLTDIPESITALANLKLLDVHDNRISDVPRGTHNLIALEELNIAENRIPYLGAELGQVPNLRRVIASHNPLIDPPEEVAVVSGEKCCEYICNLGRAPDVKVLHLDGMNLSHFPESVLSLTMLTELSCVSNQLPAIPDAFFKLKHLTLLDLSRNRIFELPSSQKVGPSWGAGAEAH